MFFNFSEPWYHYIIGNYQMSNIKILNCKIDQLNFRQVSDAIAKWINNKKTHQIVTANPEMIVASNDDSELQHIINHADLVVADGMGLVWAIQLIYKIKIERITGIDLTYHLAKLAQKNHWRIFLLGAAPGVAKQAGNHLQRICPGIRIVGTYSGNPQIPPKISSRSKVINKLRMTDIKIANKDPNVQIINLVKAARPQILLVAFGHGKQEKFISRYRNILNIPIMMGVGGTFDLLAGNSSRAPKWLQNIGLEWLWRLVQEPWRLKRIYTAVILFTLKVIKSARTGS